MTLRGSSEHLAVALVRAAAREKGESGEKEGLPPSSSPFTIALSRETGARGTSVARVLGSRLGWPVYDHEILERIAQDMKLNPSRLAAVDERHASQLEEFVECFSTAPRVSEVAYVRHLTMTLRALGAHGGCVIVGRGAALFLPARTTLRVRLLSSLEDRVAVMSRELGVASEDAARHVEESDRERVRFARHYFHKDPADPQHYDLVLNASRFSVEACAELVVGALDRLPRPE